MIRSSEIDSRQVQVESLLPSSIVDSNEISIRDKNVSGSEETLTKDQIDEGNDVEFSLEKSYEVLSSECKTSMMSSIESGDEQPDKNELMSSSQSQTDEINQVLNDKSISCSSRDDSRRGSLKNHIKKSSSFFSKLQSNSQQSSENNNSEINLNLPSSIVNAFASISPFGSSFGFGAIHNGNTSGLSIETASTSTKQSQCTESKEEIFIRRASLERKNLISLTKLIVKDLISSSLVAGRTIENCHNSIHLNNYFILIDKVLKHGLRQNILSNKSASLWAALENLPKFLKESTLMSESVRSLAHTKTPDGKIKAWIRLAMMQKKLPEYFNELLANKDSLLKDVYNEYSFMLNDEAQVFAGLIIGVNVIDCNYFVKDANFDTMDEIIELSPYLRAATSFDERPEEDEELVKRIDSDSTGMDAEKIQLHNLTKILDQKNYLEELNKRMQITVNDLRTKMNDLHEQNSKLEMEAKVSEIRIKKLSTNRTETPPNEQRSHDFQIPGAIKSLMINSADSIKSNIHKNDHQIDSTARGDLISNNNLATDVIPESETIIVKNSIGNLESSTGDDNDNSTALKVAEQSQQNLELQMQKLKAENKAEIQLYQNKFVEQEKELINLRERVTILETSYRSSLEKIKILERDLDVQISMNSDKGTTIQIYEKDVRDKQAQVESLRNSMNDAKKLNNELTERLNDASGKLKDRINSVSNLQTSLDKWKLENKTLAIRLQDKQLALRSTTNELNKLRETLDDLKKYNEKINDELKRERECGQSSSVTVETQNVKIGELMEKLANIERELTEVRPYHKQAEEYKKRCQDYEQSLEEVGSQLKESRLEVESLKENSSVFLDSQWMDSKQVKNCALCQQTFSVTRRKHHCRLCGNVFCQTCSDNKMELASSSKPVRVCDTCHAFLLAKFFKSSAASSSQANINL